MPRRENNQEEKNLKQKERYDRGVIRVTHFKKRSEKKGRKTGNKKPTIEPTRTDESGERTKKTISTKH